MAKKDNFIYVGGKPFMKYIDSVSMQFNKKHAKEVTIKARGKYISQCKEPIKTNNRYYYEYWISYKKEDLDVSVSTYRECYNLPDNEIQILTSDGKIPPIFNNLLFIDKLKKFYYRAGGAAYKLAYTVLEDELP